MTFKIGDKVVCTALTGPIVMYGRIAPDITTETVFFILDVEKDSVFRRYKISDKLESPGWHTYSTDEYLTKIS